MPLNPLTLATQLLALPSITPEDAGVADWLVATLEPLGFTCHRLPFGDVMNVYARLGTKGPHLCFAGHTDVVAPGALSDWTSPPFAPEVRDGVLYGRGAVDMKGAISAFIAAVSNYLENHDVPTGSISLLITGDEEGPALHGTRKVLEWLKARGETLDACIVGEPTNPEYLGEMAKIGRRGSMDLALTVYGTQGHVAYPHLADNPITRLITMLHRLKSETLDEGNAFFQPSNLEISTIEVGNKTGNVIPAQASAAMNIRFNNLHTAAGLEQWARRICDEAGGHYDLNVRVSGEAFLTQPGRLSELVMKAVQEVTGKTPEFSTTGGTSDARFIKDFCPVVEFGLINKTAHKVDECVTVDDLHQLARIYGCTLELFLGGK